MTDTDRIIIPIEIDTQGLKELNQIEQEIDAAENKVRQIKPRTRAATSGGDTVSRSPVQTETGGFGIFGTQSEGETLPKSVRDRTSRQAIPRGDSFDDMQKKMKLMERQNAQFYDFIMQIGGEMGYNVPFIGQGLTAARGAYGQVKKMKTFSSAPISASGGKQLKGYARLGSALVNVAKYIPIAGAVIALIDMVVNELPQIIKEELYGPGKIFDKRFKREIAKEVAAVMSRDEKAMIAQGFRTVITTTYKTARGASNVANTATKVIRNENLYNVNDDFMLRGGRPT